MTTPSDHPTTWAVPARRPTPLAIAAGLAALAMFVAATGCSSSGRTSGATLPPLIGAPTTLSLAASTSTSTATTVPGASLPTPTTVAGAPTTVDASTVAITTIGPTTTAPTTTTATTTPSTAAPASAAAWRGWPYYEVPQLGTEPVRGTGCGANGSLGDVVPDGIWNVIIGDGTGASRFWSRGSMQVDMRCVYTGDAGQTQWNTVCGSAPDADACRSQSPTWFVVNVNSRLRTMPVAAGVQYGVGGLGSTPCSGVSLDPTATAAPWRYMDSWIVVSGGVVTAVIAACPAG